MQENADQSNSEYGHFSRSDNVIVTGYNVLKVILSSYDFSVNILPLLLKIKKISNLRLGNNVFLSFLD